MATVLERPDTYAAPTARSFGEFTIERGIPVPPRQAGAGAGARYPFALMAVGDSFEVPLSAYRSKAPTLNKLATTLSNCASGYAKRHNRNAKFAVRKTGEQTIRIWRTA